MAHFQQLTTSAALFVSPESYLLCVELTKRKKNATDFTSETNALFWLSHDKFYSLSKLLLRLFKFTVIARLSAAQQTIGSQVFCADLRRFLSLRIITDGSLCEVIIHIFLSH